MRGLAQGQYYVLHGLAFLSEYQPHSSVVMLATTPPGVDKINVCFDLVVARIEQQELECNAVEVAHSRVTEALDDEVADCRQHQ